MEAVVACMESIRGTLRMDFKQGGAHKASPAMESFNVRFDESKLRKSE